MKVKFQKLLEDKVFEIYMPKKLMKTTQRFAVLNSYKISYSHAIFVYYICILKCSM